MHGKSDQSDQSCVSWQDAVVMEEGGNSWTNAQAMMLVPSAAALVVAVVLLATVAPSSARPTLSTRTPALVCWPRTAVPCPSPVAQHGHAHPRTPLSRRDACIVRSRLTHHACVRRGARTARLAGERVARVRGGRAVLRGLLALGVARGDAAATPKGNPARGDGGKSAGGH